jgi:hypothetical protein
VDAEQVLLETRIERVDRQTRQQISDEHLFDLIVRHLAPFGAHPLHIFGSHLGTTQQFFDGLRTRGLDVRVLEIFNDTHMHYGLSTMPGNAIAVGCGSYWNAMYYDHANYVHCFAGDIWRENPWSFSGIAFARFLLAWWRDKWDASTSSPLADEIVARTGLSPQALRALLDDDLSLDSLPPGCWLALGPLVSVYAARPDVARFLDQGVRQLQRFYDRFSTQVSPRDPPLLVLGGSIWSDPVFEHVQVALATAGIVVVRAQGNPAWGAVRFRRVNPRVQLEPWAYRIAI